MDNENTIFSFEEDTDHLIRAKVKNNNRKFFCIGGILIAVIIALSIALAVKSSKGGSCNEDLTSENKTSEETTTEGTSAQNSSEGWYFLICLFVYL